MISRGISTLLLLASYLLPFPLFRRWLELGAKLLYIAPHIRKGMLENSRHILGEASTHSQRKFLALAVLKNFGHAIAELLAAHREKENQNIEIKGKEHFFSAKTMNRGIIAVSLHMGSYEKGSMVIARQCKKAAIVYHRDPASFFERLRSSQRRLKKLDEIAIDASPFFAIELLNRLREGDAILMAGELAADPRGQAFPFLDGEASFSSWPGRLAVTSGAPILPAFTIRQPDQTLCLYLEEPLIAGADDSPESIMEKLVAIFERYVRQYPEQWLMIRPFWK